MGDQLSQGLGDAWALITTFVPKLLGFLLVLLVGWLVAKALSKAVEILLAKVGFGRLVERSGLGGPTSPVDAGKLIVQLVFYFVLLIALNYAFAVFGAGNPVSDLLNQVIAYLPRVVVAIILVLIASAIARVVRNLITAALAGRQYGQLLGTVSYAFLLGLGVIAALNQLGIATTVTEPILIFALGTVGGILVVGVGGGMIRPMQSRWEQWLARAQAEAASRPSNAPAQGAPWSATSRRDRTPLRRPRDSPGPRTRRSPNSDLNPSGIPGPGAYVL
ncbi:mechanosensitive ion channel family protein [Kutzneria kofuensis]|uniref:mechanosensitive ion channel family protein n=1 Tax=Kutzneria kofuensis TaxID=103725 RepID=UPI0031E756CB